MAERRIESLGDLPKGVQNVVIRLLVQAITRTKGDYLEPSDEEPRTGRSSQSKP